MADKGKTKRSLRPDFISWSEYKEPVRGTLIGKSWQDMKGGAVPKYTLETAEGRVSFLGTTQIVEAFEGLRFGSEVELIPGDKVKTGQGFFVIQFEINVYEDEPGEADKVVFDPSKGENAPEEIFAEEVVA